MLLLLIVLVYIKDCKKYGKENLAVSLGDRIFIYCLFFSFPILLAFLWR